MNHNLAIVDDTEKEGHRVVTVDTTKALYNDTPWTSLGEYGKKKFENLLKLKNPSPGIIFIYQ